MNDIVRKINIAHRECHREFMANLTDWNWESIYQNIYIKIGVKAVDQIWYKTLGEITSRVYYPIFDTLRKEMQKYDKNY